MDQKYEKLINTYCKDIHDLSKTLDYEMSVVYFRLLEFLLHAVVRVEDIFVSKYYLSRASSLYILWLLYLYLLSISLTLYLPVFLSKSLISFFHGIYIPDLDSSIFFSNFFNSLFILSSCSAVNCLFTIKVDTL